jgi:hypothetical protein
VRKHVMKKLAVGVLAVVCGLTAAAVAIAFKSPLMCREAERPLGR